MYLPNQYQKAEHWKDPRNKLFSYQVGFTFPPHDYDAAPSDFLSNLRNSDDLKPQARSEYIDIEQAPDRVKAVYEKMLPHYQHLYEYRLRATPSTA